MNPIPVKLPADPSPEARQIADTIVQTTCCADGFATVWISDLSRYQAVDIQVRRATRDQVHSANFIILVEEWAAAHQIHLIATEMRYALRGLAELTIYQVTE